MSKRPSLVDIVNILTSSTAINSNSAAVQAAFDNTLSRDGSTPNNMEADLDMDSNDLLNVGSISASSFTLNGVDFSSTSFASYAAAAKASADEASASADRAESAAEGISSFLTRDMAVTSVSNGNFDDSPDGLVLTAEGFSYYKSTGATAISDMPNWLPLGIIYAEHFGLNADFAYTTDSNGYTRTAGTNDRTAFEAADAYALASSKGFFFCRSNVYIQGELSLSAHLHWETGFRNYAWLDVPERETGIVIEDSNGGVSGVNLIIQHNTPTKQSDRGGEGNALRIGRGFTSTAQSVIDKINVDVRIQRAAAVSGQLSYPSPSFNILGNVQYCNVKIGTHGTTNSQGSIFAQCHWVGYNATADITALPVETYHPNNNKIEIVGTVVGHKRGVILSGVFHTAISSFDIDGAKQPFKHLMGDNANAYSVASQAEYVGRYNRIGFIKATNCQIDVADGTEDDAVLITARSTSKFETFPSSSKFLIRQTPVNLVCEGFDLELTGDSTSTTGVRVFGCEGKVDIGDVYTKGETKASVEVQNCHNGVSVNVQKGDMEVIYKNSTGGSILGSNIDKSSSYNGTSDYCVQIVGDKVTTVTTAAVSTDDTSVAITAFLDDDVHVGDRLYIGDQAVVATAFVDNTVPILYFTPIQGAVSSGATVTLDRRATLNNFVANFTGSEYGSNITYATIKKSCWEGIKWTGRNACRAFTNAIISVTDSFPLGTSRLVTASDYSFVLDPGCQIVLNTGVRVPYDADLQAHVQLKRTGSSGPWATMIAHGAIIEDASNLYEATEGFRQVRLLDCVDYDGNYVDHPDGAGNGSNDGWRKNADGSMQVWARNVDIGSSQPYTWTFPGGGFAEVATVSVQVTPSSATSPRMGHGYANTSTTAQVWSHNDDGSDATSTTVNLMATGRWRT